jgi:hypothetical protein
LPANTPASPTKKLRAVRSGTACKPAKVTPLTKNRTPGFTRKLTARAAIVRGTAVAMLASSANSVFAPPASTHSTVTVGCRNPSSCTADINRNRASSTAFARNTSPRALPSKRSNESRSSRSLNHPIPATFNVAAAVGFSPPPGVEQLDSIPPSSNAAHPPASPTIARPSPHSAPTTFRRFSLFGSIIFSAPPAFRLWRTRAISSPR